jgi:hypothetical protein
MNKAENKIKRFRLRDPEGDSNLGGVETVAMNRATPSYALVRRDSGKRVFSRRARLAAGRIQSSQVVLEPIQYST